MRYNVLMKLYLYHKEMKESIVVELESSVADFAIVSLAAVAG